MDDLDALRKEVDDLKAQVKNLKNVARHNYQCAVHEQMHARDNGIEPANEYPPLVDDEYAAMTKRANDAEVIIRDAVRMMSSDPHVEIPLAQQRSALEDGIRSWMNQADALADKVVDLERRIEMENRSSPPPLGNIRHYRP